VVTGLVTPGTLPPLAVEGAALFDFLGAKLVAPIHGEVLGFLDPQTGLDVFDEDFPGGTSQYPPGDRLRKPAVGQHTVAVDQRLHVGAERGVSEGGDLRAVAKFV
jgi:hypothetical protein